jgi:hypothetical protein
VTAPLTVPLPAAPLEKPVILAQAKESLVPLRANFLLEAVVMRRPQPRQAPAIRARRRTRQGSLALVTQQVAELIVCRICGTSPVWKTCQVPWRGCQVRREMKLPAAPVPPPEAALGVGSNLAVQEVALAVLARCRVRSLVAVAVL